MMSSNFIDQCFRRSTFLLSRSSALLLIVRRCPISIHSHLEECDVRFVNGWRTFFCTTRNKSSFEVVSLSLRPFACRCSATIVLTERKCLDEDYWQTKDNLLIRCRWWYLKTFSLFSVAMINGSDYSSVDRRGNSGRRMNLWTVNWMDIDGRRMTRPLSHLLSRTSSHLSSPCLFFSNEPRWKEGKCERLKIEMPWTRDGSKNESFVWRTWARIDTIDTWCCCLISEEMNNQVRHYHDEERCRWQSHWPGKWKQYVEQSILLGQQSDREVRLI